MAAVVAMLAVASPAWAAFPGDNGKISFTKVPTTFQNQEIWAADSDGSNPTNLSDNPALDTHSAWSADGTKIAFSSARDGNYEIYTMNATDGSDPKNVSNALGMIDYWPSWQPLASAPPPSVTPGDPPSVTPRDPPSVTPGDKKHDKNNKHNKHHEKHRGGGGGGISMG